MCCTFRFHNWKTQIHKVFSSLSPFPLLCWICSIHANFGIISVFMIWLSFAQMFYRFPHILILNFWILNIRKDLRLSFCVSSQGKEGTNYQLWMIIFQIRTSKCYLWQRASAQEFSGQVLYNFEEVLTCSDEL